jgi:alanine dehydrogenase
VAIASAGLEEAVKADAPLAKGINVYRGELTYQQVAEAHALDWRPLTEVIPALANGAGG